MRNLDDTPEGSDLDKIENLREGSTETMMNMVYNAVINDESGAIKSKTSALDKVEALTKILDFFVRSEEYEKCYNIKKIIDKIEC
jgi:hypothetical protein